MHPTIIPPDFLTRHNLIHRLYLAPLRGLTPRAPWAPLTDAEWDALAPSSRPRAAASPTPPAPAARWPAPAPGWTPSSAPSP